jgi:hypothetical protein
VGRWPREAGAADDVIDPSDADRRRASALVKATRRRRRTQAIDFVGSGDSRSRSASRRAAQGRQAGVRWA